MAGGGADFYSVDPTFTDFSGSGVDFTSLASGSVDPGVTAGPLDTSGTAQTDVSTLWDTGNPGQNLSGTTDPAPDTTGASFNVDPTTPIPGVGLSVNDMQAAGYTTEQIDALLGQTLGTSGMTLADATNYGYTDQGVAALIGNTDTPVSPGGNDNTNLVPMGPSGGSGSAGSSPASKLQSGGGGGGTSLPTGSHPITPQSSQAGSQTNSLLNGIFSALGKFGTAITTIARNQNAPTGYPGSTTSRAVVGTGSGVTKSSIFGSNPEVLILLLIAGALIAAIYAGKGE